MNLPTNLSDMLRIAPTLVGKTVRRASGRDESLVVSVVHAQAWVLDPVSRVTRFESSINLVIAREGLPTRTLMPEQWPEWEVLP